MEKIITEDIREYSDDFPVQIYKTDDYKTDDLKRRIVVAATNEGGHYGTQIDLIDLLEYVYKNMPNLWKSIERTANKGMKQNKARRVR